MTRFLEIWYREKLVRVVDSEKYSWFVNTKNGGLRVRIVEKETGKDEQIFISDGMARQFEGEPQ
ncbi:MAG: hypothetical protein QXV17_05310 [Candidatus Micrarchaeaceae archaeon]